MNIVPHEVSPELIEKFAAVCTEIVINELDAYEIERIKAYTNKSKNVRENFDAVLNMTALMRTIETELEKVMQYALIQVENNLVDSVK